MVIMVSMIDNVRFHAYYNYKEFRDLTERENFCKKSAEKSVDCRVHSGDGC